MRRRLLGGAAAAGGAVAIFLISTLASSGIAGASGFAGGSWSPTVSRDSSGCSAARESNVHFALGTGVGRWAGQSAASGCPAWRTTGGGSYSEVEGELTVVAPIALNATDRGVDAAWTFNYAARDAAAGTLGSCPSTTYTYDTNYGFSWYNFTEVYSDCYLLASYSLDAYSYLYDTTTGAVYGPSGYWAGIANTSGSEIYNYTYSANYSAPAYWADNSSYSYNFSYSYGPGTTSSGSVTGSSFLNGTFTSKDTYQVETTVYGYTYCEVYGYVVGKASARIDMATGGHDMVLNPFTVY